MCQTMWSAWFRSRWAQLLGVFLLALLLRLAFFIGYANVDPWDDTVYLDLSSQSRQGQVDAALRDVARQLRDGTVTPVSAFAVRRGTYVPIALCQSLFGTSEMASALPALLASLGTLLLVYRIGSYLTGERSALLGSLLYALAPLDLVYATRILADVPATFWITASVAATVEATRGSHDRRGRWLLLTLSGFCLFLAYTTRLSGLLGIPLVGAALVTAPERKRAFAESLITWTVLAGSVGLDNYRLMKPSGDFWFAFHVEKAANLAMFTAVPQAVFHPLTRLAVHCSYEEGVPHHYFKLFLGIVSHYGGIKLFSSFAPLGALALVLALARRRRSFLAFWTLFVFVYYQYGFRGLHWNGEERVLDYYLVAHHPRYLHLLLPALCLLLGALVVETASTKRAAGALLVLLLLGPSLYRARQNHAFYRGSLEDMRDASRFLCARDPAPIYTDRWAVEPLQFFSGGELKDIRVPEDHTPLEASSWALFGGSRGYELASRDVASTLPEPYASYHLDPSKTPANWQVAHERPGPRNVARRSDLFIWRVTAGLP